MVPFLLLAVLGVTNSPTSSPPAPPPPVPNQLFWTPTYHWAVKDYIGQGDPTGTPTLWCSSKFTVGASVCASDCVWRAFARAFVCVRWH